MITKRKALGSHNIAWSIAMVGALLHPMAQAAFKNPAKTSDIIVSVDGNAVDISITANRATPGALVASANALLTSVVQNVGNATNGNVVNIPTTTAGSGSGARVSLVVSGNAVSGVTVVSEGSGYAAGDTLTVAASDIPNASQNLILQLVADDIDNLDDTTTDVAFEAWVSSEPWWDTPPTQGGNTTDEFNTLLPACAASPAANDPACFVKASSGIYGADGTTRVGGENDFSVWTTQITPEEGNGFDSIIELAPIAANNGTGFAITSGSIVKMMVSWPTAGQLYPGVNYGQGTGEIDLLKLVADTPVKLDTTTAAIDDNKNKWSNARVSNRVVTTLIGEARTTSAAISRETWWPQCDVTFNESGAVVSKKCGADMASNVTSGYMVFSSVPARLAVIVDSFVDKVAGGLVSTNGQGFSFGRQTFDADEPAYEFTSSGPSYNSAGAARTADGFYYVCLPATYLDQVHGTDAATAKTSWIGTRKDGAASAQSLAVDFQPGTCGLNDAGLVAKVAAFGYSSPVFQLKSGAPGQPTITQVTMGNGQTVVTFTPPASPGSSTITQYVVTANPGGITKDCGTTSPCTVTGLTNGTNYTFTITATNSNGTSSPSAGYSSGATSIPTLPTALLLLLSLGLLSLVRLKGISRR